MNYIEKINNMVKFEDEKVTINASSLMWGAVAILFMSIAGTYFSMVFYPANAPKGIIDILVPAVLGIICFFMADKSR